MTLEQKMTLETLLQGAAEFHHGDCVGADAEAHAIALGKVPITIWPPANESQRAFCKGAATTKPADDYLVRNRKIVQATERLIAAPKGFKEELRSGTWAAIRHARYIRKPVIIIWPSGVTS